MERSTFYLLFDRYILYFPSFFFFRIHFSFYRIAYATNLRVFHRSIQPFQVFETIDVSKKKRIIHFPVARSFSSEKFYFAFARKKEKKKNISTSPHLWTKLWQPSCGCIANIKDPQDAAKFRDEPVGNLKLSVPSFPIRRSSPSRSIVPPRKTITVHEKGGFKACDDIPYAGLVVIIQA